MTAKYRQVERLTRGVNGRVKRTAQLVLERRPVANDVAADNRACELRLGAIATTLPPPGQHFTESSTARTAPNPPEHAPDELPPGWRRNPSSNALDDGVFYEPHGWMSDPVCPCVGVMQRGYWVLRGMGNCAQGEMHECMRIARGIATIDELWSTP